MTQSIPVYTIPLPDYTLEPEPDWLAIGRKLDAWLEAHFPGRGIAIRGIGLIDHPDRSLEDLVATIVELGTDRYDPNRGGVHDDFGPDYLHAGPCVVTKEGLQAEKHLDGSVMAKVFRLFHVGTLADRGYSIRLDILMIYDLDQLQPAAFLSEEVPTDPLRSYTFTFKHPGRKIEALLGVIQLLR